MMFIFFFTCSVVHGKVLGSNDGIGEFGLEQGISWIDAKHQSVVIP